VRSHRPAPRTTLANAIVRAAVRFAYGRSYRALLDATKDPRAVQADLLRRIVAANADTDFGREHGFTRVRTVADFRAAVPVQDYEALRPHVEHQERSGDRCLTADPPVYYHRTSGTLGKPKDIPVTAAGLRRIKDNQRLLTHTLALGTRAFEGKVFGITGQAVEGRMAGGTAYGSASGLLYKEHSRLVRRRYVLPAETADIDDYEGRYFVMAVYGLAEPAVSCVGTANPSTLVRLQTLIQERTEALLRAVHDGALPGSPSSGSMSPAPNPARAAVLARVLAAKGILTYADIWPNLRAVVTWTGGSCKIPLARLAGSLPPGVAVVELGYLASEFQGTVNLDAGKNLCVPTLCDTLFEFVERDSRETGRDDFLSLHELVEGREYYVFVTTLDGLYRYDMNDIVRVTGRLNGTPCLEFVQKGKGVTSITGEKLYEGQVVDAVMATAARLGVAAEFFVMLADEEASGYTLFIESGPSTPAAGVELADALDRGLRETNVEYEAKRDSGRLAPVRVQWLAPGAGAAYRAERVAQGQRDAQFKYLHLQYARECAFDFAARQVPD